MSAVSARRRRCCSAALPANFMCALRRSASASWPGRDALDTPRQRDPAVPLRVSERDAREKACEHPDKVCHGESCPFARGFCDRPPAARAAAVATGPLTREAPRSVAFAHEPCAHYFGQDVARWCDVIVGDYNHCFDSAAMLHGLTIANAWRVGVLVDDARNLVGRARAMYSAGLASCQLHAITATAPAALLRADGPPRLERQSVSQHDPNKRKRAQVA